ncbi:protein of unknown function [Methylotuvimicrobium alcaliphilum 20Z]|uniref:Transposase n=1 Tax=Methylotuvimicrobium alcaliphilum (strain DSM 19304 / NCIMB 14124 / VKM B-2133 / 20Z) TaxID=1091494 RepID=G4SU05_META2|nr:protein of unknown function [Methylotuvimicrobium alcaliphilum 20Z]
MPRRTRRTRKSRRAAEVSSAFAAEPSRITSEVLEKAARRTFTAEYKERILTQADACSEPGCIGKLLRTEGLYSSHLSKWRSEREQAIRAGLSKPRGRKPSDKNPLAAENARLQAEIQRLQACLTQAEAIIDVQKKLSQLLGLCEIPAHTGRAS